MAFQSNYIYWHLKLLSVVFGNKQWYDTILIFIVEPVPRVLFEQGSGLLGVYRTEWGSAIHVFLLPNSFLRVKATAPCARFSFAISVAFSCPSALRTDIPLTYLESLLVPPTLLAGGGGMVGVFPLLWETFYWDT